MSCKIYGGPHAVEEMVWPVAAQGRSPQAPLKPAVTNVSENADAHAQEIANLRTQVRDARAAGLAAGKQAAEAELEPVLERLSSTVAELCTLRARLRKQAEDDLVKLALGIAKLILRRELTVDPDALRGIVGAALEKVQNRDIARIRLHPDHEAAVRRHLDTFHVANVEVIADRTLRPGDLVLDTSRGALDASIETQLSEIERGLVDRLAK
jgi:flagellar assembly protein FliH